MTSPNRNEQTRNQNFKQVEADGWRGSYLAAISAGVVMTIVLLLAISCSQKANKSEVKTSAPVAAPELPAPNETAGLVEGSKKVKKHRPQNATYVNSAYGVSFSYPRKYSLEASNQNSSMPVPAGFLKSGAIEVASVDMPSDSYEETDFSSALLNLAVNPQVTAAECAQFKSTSADPDAPKPVAVKLGANEFSELEAHDQKADRQSDLKYFHLFKNSACYEFTLDVETANTGEHLAQLERAKVFGQLKKILTTARIKDVELPGTEKARAANGAEVQVDAIGANGRP